ncbi:MAG: glycyl-radical enzyme activating protein [Candidatus Marinimicrobia bacterium]|nr:glycyl-radical enzyme activating protein [Candidatus Neomarinimicrobiota bacterium]
MNLPSGDRSSPGACSRPDETPSGTVFDIQKFSIHDGPGIRTTVFLKGCPLRCLWCHNPESQDSLPEISLIASKCVGCGQCVQACPLNNHVMGAGGERIFHRARCRRCGACAENCYAGAIEVIGRTMSVEEVIADVVKDRAFYETSGGGMTLSGGEPMAQPAFSGALLRQAKDAGLHCVMETCGFAAYNLYATLLPDVDLFLFDLKDTDPARHRENTGVALEPIVENLRRLDTAGCRIWLRCPIIPGINAVETHLAGIASLAGPLTHVERITLLPYHPFGQSKYARLSIPDPMLPCRAEPTDHDMDRWRNYVANRTTIPVDVS